MTTRVEEAADEMSLILFSDKFKLTPKECLAVLASLQQDVLESGNVTSDEWSPDGD